jgi:hypothetical protein
MQQSVIPIGVAYTQLIEDFRAIVRHELQTHTPAPATAQNETGKDPRTVRQVADKFGVCVATVWEWARTGKIASHKIGGRTYFFEQEVIAALEKNQRTLKTKKAQ